RLAADRDRQQQQRDGDMELPGRLCRRLEGLDVLADEAAFGKLDGREPFGQADDVAVGSRFCDRDGGLGHRGRSSVNSRQMYSPCQIASSSAAWARTAPSIAAPSDSPASLVGCGK